MSKEPMIQLPDYIAIPVAFSTADQVVDWGHNFLKTKDFWLKSRGEKAVIFVLDTAGQFDHPDLTANCIPVLNKNFTSDATMADEHGHGTHCAGIAAAVDNGFGVVGCAPGAGLAAVKMLGKTGGGNLSWGAQAIRYVADVQLPPEHAGKKKIISASWGASQGTQELHDAIKYAISKGVFIVAAAGNSGFSGSNSINWPGRYEEVITVAALQKDGNPASFSSGGPEVDVAGPGLQIYSTHLGAGYVYLSGTSMATPYVAGVAALLVSYYSEITNQAQLEAFLEKYAKDVFTAGEDDRTGAGAPVLPGYLEQDPGDEEPSDPEPPTGPPTRENRVLSYRFSAPGDIWWRTLSETQMKKLTIQEVEVSLLTNLYGPAAYRQVSDLVQGFYKNRGLILQDGWDYVEAAQWAGRFLQIIGRKTADITVVGLSAVDEQGNTILLGLSQLGKAASQAKLDRLPSATFIMPR